MNQTSSFCTQQGYKHKMYWYSSQFAVICRREVHTDGDSQVCVNFDSELVKLLREVHDFLLLPSLPGQLPDMAVKVRA